MAMFLTVFRKKLDSSVLVENCLGDGKANKTRPIRTLLRSQDERFGDAMLLEHHVRLVLKELHWSGCRRP